MFCLKHFHVEISFLFYGTERCVLYNQILYPIIIVKRFRPLIVDFKSWFNPVSNVLHTYFLIGTNFVARFMSKVLINPSIISRKDYITNQKYSRSCIRLLSFSETWRIYLCFFRYYPRICSTANIYAAETKRRDRQKIEIEREKQIKGRVKV